MKYQTLAVLAGGVLALGACATPQDGPQHRRGDAPQQHALISADALVFVSFDTDNDLRITQAELEAGIAREFARADANHDGSISPIEFQNWAATALGGDSLPPYRLDFDRNVDNVITQKEFHDELMARAHAYDANNDGVLTRDEFIKEINQARPPMQERPNGFQRGGEGGGRRGGPYGG
ncbi:MAG: hypothetical protein ABUL73_03090 [Alphaproteobacteria bacterium]